MNLKPYLLFATLILCLATSCKKHTKKHIGPHTDIYMAGSTSKYHIKQDSHSITTAVYWKNGKQVLLSDSLTDAYAAGIAVNKNDIYVVGGIRRMVNSYVETSIAAYWKNGVLTQLGKGTIDKVAFKGNDVYMVGTAWGGPGKPDQAILWKNDKVFSLGKGRLNSIYIDGDDIYVAGCKLYAVEQPTTSYLRKEYTYYPAAAYWKNGEPIMLNDTTSGSTYANNIFVQNGDVYTAGADDSYRESKPICWKNRKRFELASQAYPRGYVSGIVVDNLERYTLCGAIDTRSYNYLAVYWQSGRMRSLEHKGKSSSAQAISILGNDRYIVGSDDGHPVYWKNGNRIEVGKDEGGINSIALVNY